MLLNLLPTAASAETEKLAQFKSFLHDKMLTTLKTSNRPADFVMQCKYLSLPEMPESTPHFATC
jgi:hypothetical protein